MRISAHEGVTQYAAVGKPCQTRCGLTSRCALLVSTTATTNRLRACLFLQAYCLLYLLVCLYWIWLHTHAFSCLNNCLRAHTLPNPVFLSATMSASRCADCSADVFYAVYSSLSVICLSAVLIFPPRYWKISSLWSQGGVTRQTGRMVFQSNHWNNTQYKLYPNSNNVVFK